MVKNLKHLHNYIFHSLQQFTTKLCKFTNFKVLYLAVVKDWPKSKFSLSCKLSISLTLLFGCIFVVNKVKNLEINSNNVQSQCTKSIFPANNSDLGSSENLVVGKIMLIIEFSPCPCNQALGCKIIESGNFVLSK